VLKALPRRPAIKTCEIDEQDCRHFRRKARQVGDAPIAKPVI